MKIYIFLGLLLAIFALIVSGCATTEGYKQRVQSWVGLSEVHLVRGWGVPAQVYQTGGVKYLVYNSSRNVYLPGTSPTYTTTFVGNTAYTTSYGGSAPQNLNFQCSTTFEIINGRVSSWRFKGNDCRAPENSVNNGAYTAAMNKASVQIKMDKKYTHLNLNTSEKKKWFTNITYRLWSGKINKKTFINEGLKRYPTKQYEFKLIADLLEYGAQRK